MSFYATGAKHVIFTPKRSTNLAEKTLADGKECKTWRRSAKKWTKWSKFTLKQQKQKTKHVIFGTYRQFKNIIPKIKGPKIKALYNQ